MGRKGLKSHTLKSIIVSINNITVKIPLNNNELIENKKEVKEALQITALEFKKMISKMNTQNTQLSSSNEKIKDNKRNKKKLKLCKKLKMPEKSNSDYSFINQKIKEEKIKNIQMPINPVVEIPSEEQYESQIISDWDRLWGDDTNNISNNINNPNAIYEPIYDYPNNVNVGIIGSSIFNTSI